MMQINECGCGCGNPMGGCAGQEKEMENYMFFGNLKTIKAAIDAMMEMDPEEVDAILTDGHGWAADHVATSKDDLQEVADFLMSRLGGEDTHPAFAEEDHHEMPFVHTFESFNQINEAKKAKKKKDQDGDGDSDFADAKIAQYKAGGVPKKKAIAMSRKFNK